MKLTYYYVRHGQTLFNTLHRLQGSCDSPLTKQGILQAKDIASVLRNVHFNAIYTSSAERAMDTANIIASYHNVRPIALKEFKEYSFSSFDGMRYEDIQDELEKYYDQQTGTYTCGEGLENFQNRMYKALQYTQDNASDGDTILLVSHGAYFGLMMKLLCQNENYLTHLLGNGGIAIGNCQCAVITYEDGKYTLTQQPLYATDIRHKQNKHIHFYYCRHGETDFNERNMCQGQCDSPLTMKGIHQAETTAKALQNVPFTKAFVSYAERARDTAKMITKYHKIPFTYDKRLKEVSFGTFEAKDIIVHRDRIHQIHINEDWSMYGGENAIDITNRIQDVMHDIVDSCEDGDTVLLVGHALLYRCFLKFFFQIQNYDGPINASGYPVAPNAGIFTFDYDNGEYKINHYMESAEEYVNRTTH